MFSRDPDPTHTYKHSTQNTMINRGQLVLVSKRMMSGVNVKKQNKHTHVTAISSQRQQMTCDSYISSRLYVYAGYK